MISNTLDLFSKDFEQLQLFLVEEASLIGALMLWNIDNRLWEIMHTSNLPFGNIDVIFFGYFYQEQPIKDS